MKNEKINEINWVAGAALSCWPFNFNQLHFITLLSLNSLGHSAARSKLLLSAAFIIWFHCAAELNQSTNWLFSFIAFISSNKFTHFLHFFKETKEGLGSSLLCWRKEKKQRQQEINQKSWLIYWLAALEGRVAAITHNTSFSNPAQIKPILSTNNQLQFHSNSTINQSMFLIELMEEWMKWVGLLRPSSIKNF